MTIDLDANQQIHSNINIEKNDSLHILPNSKNLLFSTIKLPENEESTEVVVEISWEF